MRAVLVAGSQTKGLSVGESRLRDSANADMLLMAREDGARVCVWCACGVIGAASAACGW
jgi:hypothetical protein